MIPVPPRESVGLRRRVALAGLALIALAAAGRLFVYSDDATPKENADMPATKDAVTAIPPIDAEATAVTGTATFSLG